MRLLPSLPIVALVALLAACGPDPVRMPAPPDPTPSAPFASDAEALAAAEEAYAAYLEMSDLISSEGGVEPERIAPFVSEDHRDRAVASFSPMLDRQLHTSGSSAFELSDIVFHDQYEIQVGVCLDISGVRVLDASETDVTPPSRADLIALRVLFELDMSGVLVAGSESAESSQC